MAVLLCHECGLYQKSDSVVHSHNLCLQYVEHLVRKRRRDCSQNGKELMSGQMSLFLLDTHLVWIDLHCNDAQDNTVFTRSVVLCGVTGIINGLACLSFLHPEPWNGVKVWHTSWHLPTRPHEFSFLVLSRRFLWLDMLFRVECCCHGSYWALSSIVQWTRSLWWGKFSHESWPLNCVFSGWSNWLLVIPPWQTSIKMH